LGSLAPATTPIIPAANAQYKPREKIFFNISTSIANRDELE
jgi:hypothetical protein